jgi:glycosyltransferase involved in cell wall biosynthesis
MDTSALKVTVLLPTYNRERLLREAIESLYRQTLDPKQFVVLVIDNCSTDNTPAMIAELQKTAPFQIVYKRMEKNGGCFRSLNLGVELSPTEIVASLDSDCWAHPEWLQRGLDAFEKAGDVGFVAGHIADKPGQPIQFFSLRNGAPAHENPFYPSGNCFYRRSVVLRMGGFDENLAFGEVGTSPIGCADSDLAWRTIEAGYGHAYCGDAIAYHEVTTVKPLGWLKAHWRMVSIPALIRKHPGLRSYLTWGLFFMPDNRFFYLAVAGLAAGALATPWGLLACGPYLINCAMNPGKRFTWSRIPRTAARIVLLTLRQVVISSSLVYGSLRARTLVL